MTAIEKATAALQERLAEIDAEKAQLERALASLDGSGTSKRRSDGKRKLAPRGQRREQLLSHLEKNPNSKPSEIARAIKTSPANVHNILRKAREDKLVRKARGGGYSLTKTTQQASEGS